MERRIPKQKQSKSGDNGHKPQSVLQKVIAPEPKPKAPKPQDVEPAKTSDGYAAERQHVAWMDIRRLGLQYRRKKLSDGEARRYFIGFIQVAYVRFYNDGAIKVCGIYEDRAHDREFKTEDGAHKYIMAELQGTES